MKERTVKKTVDLNIVEVTYRAFRDMSLENFHPDGKFNRVGATMEMKIQVEKDQEEEIKALVTKVHQELTKALKKNALKAMDCLDKNEL